MDFDIDQPVNAENVLALATSQRRDNLKVSLLRKWAARHAAPDTPAADPAEPEAPEEPAEPKPVAKKRFVRKKKD